MDEITQQVRDMYSRYPFPSNDKIENELPSYLPEFLKRALNKSRKNRSKTAQVVVSLLEKQEKPWRYLDAGCGTGETALQIMRELEDTELHACDLTPTSVEKAKKLVERETLEATIREVDLMKPLPYDDDSLSVVTSLGVIHHLSDPVVGLKNIARCLKPEGYLVCYLYGRLGRQDEIWKRELVHLLAGKRHEFDHKIKIVKALELHPRSHSSSVKEFFYNVMGFDRDSSRDVWIVDQLAHVSEREYDVPEIEADLEAANMELVEFYGFPNQLSDMIDDPEILESAKDLSHSEQLRALELMIRPSGYLFSARRKPA